MGKKHASQYANFGSLRLNDLFACWGLAQTRKLLTNFSKNSFYLLPEPLRRGEFLTNYCK